jgi:hypothetical protein
VTNHQPLSGRSRDEAHATVDLECVGRVVRDAGDSVPRDRLTRFRVRGRARTVSTYRIGNFRRGIASRTSTGAGPEETGRIHRLGSFLRDIPSRTSTSSPNLVGRGSIHRIGSFPRGNRSPTYTSVPRNPLLALHRVSTSRQHNPRYRASTRRTAARRACSWAPPFAGSISGPVDGGAASSVSEVGLVRRSRAQHASRQDRERIVAVVQEVRLAVCVTAPRRSSGRILR